MKIAICTDKSGGVLFNNRRVSRDSAVISKLLDFAGENHILLSEYSSKLFENTDNLVISDDFISMAKDDDICFVENVNFDIQKVSKLYLFNWNRDYPADLYFEFDAKKSGFKKISTEDFEGSSHEKITLDIYGRQ